MIVGVDIGTSVTKAAGIDREGRAVVSASQESVLHRLSGGRVEQDLDDVVASVAQVVRDVVTHLDEAPEAIAITGQGDGLWLRDADGVPTHPPISWMDARAADLVESWRIGGPYSVVARVHELTGSGIFPGCHAALLAHLAAVEPEALERAAVAGYCCDAVLEQLTGVVAIDASDASLPFLDVRTRTYVDEALELCGLGRWRHLLVDPAPPGTLYALSARGADLLGLPADLPVSAGPYDLQACGIGSGARQVGQGTVVLGTTLSCQVLTDDATVEPGSEPAGMWLCTPDPEMYLRVMPSMVGMSGIGWALTAIGAHGKQLDDVLAGSKAGAGGVRALSFLSPAGERAPFVEPRARGELTGLTMSSSPADLVQAVCESVAFAARSCFDALGLDGELSACGGGTQSEALAQIFADVLARPVLIPRESMVGARGAAAVAWQSMGDPVDLDAWSEDRRVVEPTDDGVALHEAGYQRYLDDVGRARTAWT
jgi:sugar (pentulose or hexulose) kinase